MKEKELYSYIATKALVANDKGEILIIKETFGGEWELPGGKINRDEVASTREDCLGRELNEELGQDFVVEIGNLFDTSFRYFHKPRNPDVEYVFFVVFMCKYLSGEIKMQEEELSDFAWVNKNNYEGYMYVDGYKTVLDKYFNSLN